MDELETAFHMCTICKIRERGGLQRIPSFFIEFLCPHWCFLPKYNTRGRAKFSNISFLSFMITQGDLNLPLGSYFTFYVRICVYIYIWT